MTPVLNNPPKPNLNRRQAAALSLLAKLLASEDIRVQHLARAATASFDTKSRTLTLPVWNAMGGDLYDMLVAHEVGHALFTPKGDGWVKQLQEIAGSKFDAFKAYVNILEDSRIERMMKDAYPGLRSTFARAYRDLSENKPKFFALDRDLNDLPLIDRVNIHYKVGFAVTVPFSAKEMPLVRRVAETKTWDEVIELAKEFFDFSANEESQSDNHEDGSDDGDGEGEGQQSDKQDKQDKQDGSKDSKSKSKDKGEDEEGEEQSRGETADEGENSDPEDGTEGGDEKTDGGEESESDNSQDSAAEGETDREEEAATNGKPAKDAKGKPVKTPRESVTEKALEQLSKENRDDSYYAESTGSVRMPTFDSKVGIVPFSEVYEDLKLMAERNDGFRRYQAFMAKNRQSINSLVQEFMRRKAADEATRTRTADTGSIDPSRLWAYRISEEVFGTYEIRKEGKNHGIVFLVDWSGSMNRILEPTIMQLGCLVQFCAAAAIPCEVYAFSNGGNFEYEGQAGNPLWSKGNGEVQFAGFRLLNLLSASAKPAQIKVAMAGLLAWAKKGEMPNGYGNAFGKNAKDESLDNKYYLNGTPLNAAVASMVSVVPQFKAKTGVQIVNTVILTDGDATDSVYYRYDAEGNSRSLYGSDSVEGYGRDFRKVNFTGNRAVETFDGTTDSLIRFLRVEADCNVIGFRIDSGRALNSTVNGALARVAKDTEEYKRIAKAGGATAYAAAKKKFLRDEGWVSGEEWLGYTEWFGVSDLQVDDADYLDEIDETSTKAKLAKALSAEIGKSKSSRPLMARIAARVSKK